MTNAETAALVQLKAKLELRIRHADSCGVHRWGDCDCDREQLIREAIDALNRKPQVSHSAPDVAALVQRLQQSSRALRLIVKDRTDDADAAMDLGEVETAAELLQQMADVLTPRTQEPPPSPHDRMLLDMRIHAECDATVAELAEKLATRTAERDALQQERDAARLALRDQLSGICAERNILENENRKFQARLDNQATHCVELRLAKEAAEAQLAALTAENDEAQGQLRAIDNLLARRPALDEPTRYDNIAKAIRVAAHADVALRKQIAAESKLSALTAEGVRLREALEQSVKLQSYYAELLNMHDAGQRLTFDGADAWLDRLKALIPMGRIAK